MEPVSARSVVLGSGASLAHLALALLLLAPWGAVQAQPRLRVAGSNASNEVRLRTTSDTFRHVLRVDLLPSAASPGGGVDELLPGGVTVLVDPLQSQDGVQVPLAATVGGESGGGTTAVISARQPLSVELSGRLPTVGDYTGQVVLIHAGGRETASLVVTRVQAAPTVQFVATSPAVASSGWGWRPVDASVRLPFRETAGVAGRMAVPQLLQLQRKTPDLGAALIQPRLTGAHFALEGAPQGADGQDAGTLREDIPVEAHGSGALVLTLRGLDGPGEYTGTVRVAVPAGVPVEQTFTIWVRSPWTWGALLIALGALSSYSVRLYTQHIRPRAQRLQRALALSRRLQALMTGQDAKLQEVGLALRGQLDALVSEIRKPVRGIRVGDAELAGVEPRLRLYEVWCAASRTLRALPEELHPPEASKRLSAVATSLRSEDATAEQLLAQLKAVRELDVEGLARAGLEAQLLDIEGQARALSKQRGKDPLGLRLTYELLPLLQSVRGKLKSANLGVARQQFELARRSYFDILCAELSTAVAAPLPPRGFTDEEWLELTTDVKERLRQARTRADTSVDEAFRLYQGAHAIYVRQLITELRRDVETAQQDATTEAHRSTLKGIDDALGGAMGFLSATSPHEAAVAYDEARADFTRYQQPPRAGLGVINESLVPDGGEVAGMPRPTNMGAPTGGVIPTLPEAPAGTSALGDFEAMPLPSPRHMWMVELGVLLLLTGVAVALGLQLLNVFSPTWGGFGAGMTAFLWGFGLHQVGNATFEGLTGLLTRVEKQTTPGP
ncbi:hypothetical protein [Pyxidicoccus trucidator]|uniref:hypothetical protein n=1 Tax=Pyxidicoccus trucidator TaxID=2709662 RepID=UPI0013D9AE50|nr:hypothetical protein [Pyxidicoccus trucidator]